MSMTASGPCDWPIEHCPCDAFDEVWPDEDQAIVDQASYLLWAATNKIYGPCPVSVLPCGDPYILCGTRYGALRRCGCASVSEIRLDGPVDSVTEVVIDGAVLDPFAYQIADYEWLVRIDGGRWPTGSDPADPDSFRVDYMLGEPPPRGAAAVTGELACEIAKSQCNHPSCRLPNNVRSVTRQGVTIQTGRNIFIDPNFRFGLPNVDMWVDMAIRPVLAGAVHSPDIPMIRRITWQAEPSPSSP